MDQVSDIWIRFARLEACCDVRITTVYAQTPGQPFREWEVEIRHRNPPGEGKLVRVRDQILVEALLRAIIQAEARGWPGAPPAPPAPEAAAHSPSTAVRSAAISAPASPAAAPAPTEIAGAVAPERTT